MKSRDEIVANIKWLGLGNQRRSCLTNIEQCLQDTLYYLENPVVWTPITEGCQMPKKGEKVYCTGGSHGVYRAVYKDSRLMDGDGDWYRIGNHGRHECKPIAWTRDIKPYKKEG